jgi:hypothetical protein
MKYLYNSYYVCIVFLVAYQNCIAQEYEKYYQLHVHVTHSDKHNQEKWLQCLNLACSLAEECEKTKNDSSADAFVRSQKYAVEAIREMYNLYHEESTIQFAMHISSKPLDVPNKGLSIVFEYYISKETPQDNQIRADAIMRNLQRCAMLENYAVLLENLSELEDFFFLVFGRSILSVDSFEK